MPQGTTTIDFGAFPGTSDASATVTGQTAIVAGSAIEAWMRIEASADHSADEHAIETIKIVAKDIVAGTGFTIMAMNSNQINEHEPPQFITHQGQSIIGTPRQAGQWPANYSEGKGTRLYGIWNVSWVWN